MTGDVGEKEAYDNLVAWMSMNAPYHHMVTFKARLAELEAGHAGGGGVVKPLEYVKPHGSKTLAKAETILGVAYVYTHPKAGDSWFWKLGDIASGTEANEADCKQMLWLTYEARILAALAASPAATRGAVSRFDEINAAYVRGASWAQMMGQFTPAELNKAAYDYADAETPPVPAPAPAEGNWSDPAFVAEKLESAVAGLGRHGVLGIAPVMREAASLLRALATPPATRASAEPGPFGAVMAEVKRATTKFPTWPTDPLHALAVLGEEFGELTKETLQLTYEPHKSTMEDFRKEAHQTAAMALRFLASIDAYQFTPGVQHRQNALAPSPDKPATATGKE